VDLAGHYHLSSTVQAGGTPVDSSCNVIASRGTSWQTPCLLCPSEACVYVELHHSIMLLHMA
jgi:hypothetical protein